MNRQRFEQITIDPALEEVSLETRLPAHQVVEVRPQPGGAGTVLANAAALQPRRVEAVGFCGWDGEGYELMQGLRRLGGKLDFFIRTRRRRTFTYTKPLVIRPGDPPQELPRLDIRDRTPTPGADTSGLSLSETSTATGPRLLKEATLSPLLVAPTVKAATYMAGGSCTLQQPGPLLPAEATTTIPAARTFSTTVWRVCQSHPSLSGQVQELLITWGARLGTPSVKGSPPKG